MACSASLLLFCAAIARSPQDDSTLPEILLGADLRGVVAADSPVIRTKTLAAYPYHRRTLRGTAFWYIAEASAPFAVRVDSEDFDPYIVVEDVASGVIIEAGHETCPLEAEILVPGEAAHEYRLAVVACDGGAGAFRLRITPAAEPPAADPVGTTRAALARCESALGHDSLAAARLRLALGALLTSIGRSAQGQPLIESALHTREQLLPADHPAVVEALTRLAECELDRDDTTAGEATLERLTRLQVAAYGEESPEASKCHIASGVLRHRQGHYDAAEREYQRALAIAERVLPPDHLEIAHQVLCLAIAQTEMGAFDTARRNAERALRIRLERLGPDAPGVAEVLNVLGQIALQQNLPVPARVHLEQALAILERRVPRAQPPLDVVHSHLGFVAYLQGSYDEALAHFDEALRLAEQERGPGLRIMATILTNRAATYFNQKRYDEARADLERAIDIREHTIGLAHPDSLPAINNLAAVLRAAGKYDAAASLHERVLALTEQALGPEHPDTAVQLSNLAFVIERAQPERALTLAARAVAVRRRLLARQMPVLTENERLSWAAALRVSLDQVLSLSQRHPGVMRTADLYGEVLAWKGQVSRGLFAERAWLQEHADQQALEQMHTLHRLLGQMSRSVFAATGLRTDRDAAELARLLSERALVEHQLASSSNSAALEPPLRLAELQARLGPADVLIDYLVYQHSEPPDASAGNAVRQPRLLAFVTRHDGDTQRVELGATEPIERALEAHLRITSRRVAANDDAGLASYASAVRDLVWQPLEPLLLHATRVFVSPDGALATLPFETLCDRRGERFLIEDYQFVYLQTSLALLQPLERDGGSSGVLLAGGIDYDLGSGALPGASPLRAVGPLLAPLPATIPEVRELAALWSQNLPDGEAPALTLTGAEATEESVKRSVPRKRYVHLATHGFAAPEEAQSKFADAIEDELSSRVKELVRHAHELRGQLPGLLSGLAFAGANHAASSADDGILTAEEAAWLDLHGCELVTLSACNTGLGTPRAGESLLGLRRSFHLAGARTTITALWRVADDATRELMVSFYRRLWHDHATKADALRGAQLEMLQRNRERHGGRGLPGTWGAFLLEGDWR